jgi:hypothetical protein
MGLFSNLTNNPDALAMLAGANALGNIQPIGPSRVPVGLAYGAVSGLQAAGKAVSEIPKQASDLMNLQLQSAAQPSMLAMYGSMNPSAPGGGAPAGGAPGSPAMNPMAANALRFAMMSRDPKTMASTATSIYENDPTTVAAKERERIVQRADGTWGRAGDLLSGSGSPLGVPPMPGAGASSAPPVAPPSRTPQIMPNGQPDNVDVPPQNLDDVLNQVSKSTSVAASGVPKLFDGKPIIPEANQLPFFKPDPSGQPAWPALPNTKEGVEQALSNQKEMQAGSQEFASLGKSFSNENAQIDDLIDTYHKMPSGTFTAQNPEYLAKLNAWFPNGLPPEVKSDLGNVQRALDAHQKDVIAQMKDTNANIGGGTATRLFGSEIVNQLEKGINPGNTPEANFSVLTKAKGMLNQGQDLIQGWNSIGGRANRLQNGNSMLPDDFAQKFYDAHKTQDYIDAARKNTPPFKGMSTSNDEQKIQKWIRVNGQLVAQ